MNNLAGQITRPLRQLGPNLRSQLVGGLLLLLEVKQNNRAEELGVELGLGGDDVAEGDVDGAGQLEDGLGDLDGAEVVDGVALGGGLLGVLEVLEELGAVGDDGDGAEDEDAVPGCYLLAEGLGGCVD